MRKEQMRVGSVSGAAGERDREARNQHPMLLFAKGMEDAANRKGWLGVHIALSRLRPENRSRHTLRMASESFDKSVEKFKGRLFTLANGDFVGFFKNAQVDDIDQVVLRLRHLFSNDPMFSGASSDTTRFTTWYNLATEYRAFLNQINTLVRHEAVDLTIDEDEEDDDEDFGDDEDLVAAPTGADQAAKPTAPQGGARVGMGDSPQKSDVHAVVGLHPAKLNEVVSKIKEVNVGNMIRRQYICLINGVGAQPKPVFSEVFVSIGDLANAILPGVNITSDRWLFQYVTNYLDQRMLDFLTSTHPMPVSKAFSLNVNVGTLLSSQFKKLDSMLQPQAKRTVMFELQTIDIYSDMGAFVFARDTLQEKGYRICIDGLNPLTLPFVNRRSLGLDLMKIYWTSDMRANQDGRRAAQIQALVQAAGPSRVILCRCDDESAILYGMNLGITLFQGRYLDSLLRSRQQRPAAAAQ